MINVKAIIDTLLFCVFPVAVGGRLSTVTDYKSYNGIDWN